MVGHVDGRDGKSYRAKALMPAQRIALVAQVHYLSHVEHMSVRSIVLALGQLDGLKVSRGTVHNYLTNWHCGECQG
jgi:hypothetical protein